MYQNSKGFTLIELILVIALLGIVSYAAIPAFTGVQIFGLDNAARKLESDIRYAQSVAMTTGEQHGFRTIVDSSDSNYEIYNVDTGAIINNPHDRLPMQEDFAESYPGIVFKSGTNYHIRFDPQGNPSFITGGSSIVLTTSDGDEKTLIINTIGLVDIQ